MKRILAAALLLPMLTGCATLERLDSVKSSAEKLLEDPAKLKNYPFAITAQQLVAMVN